MADSTEYLTVVYRNVSAWHAQTFICHDKMAAASWSHAIHDRDKALAARQADEALMREAMEALDTMLRQFTKVPSTLADSTARGNGHATLSKLKERLQ